MEKHTHTHTMCNKKGIYVYAECQIYKIVYLLISYESKAEDVNRKSILASAGLTGWSVFICVNDPGWNS